MGKIVRRLFLGAALGLLLTGCAPEQPAAPLPTMQLKFASGLAEGDTTSQAIKIWGDLVTQRTGGRITFQYFWAGSLLRLPELLDGIRDGRADAGIPFTTFVSGKIPDVAPLDVLFSFPHDDVNLLKFVEEVDPIIDGIYQKFNQKVLWFNPAQPPSMMVCKDKFLDSPAAWKGTIVRTAGRWQGENVKGWGGSPISIDLADVYTALQRGTVECAILGYSVTDTFRFYEVAKSYTRIDAATFYGNVTINLDVWNKLPKSDQEIMLKAGEEAKKKGLELRNEVVVKSIEKFKANGVKLCTPSKEELTRLRGVSRQVLDQIAKEVGEPGKKILEIVAKYQAQVTPGPALGEITPCPGR